MNDLIHNFNYLSSLCIRYFIFVRIIYIMLTIIARLNCANMLVSVDKLIMLVLFNFDFLTQDIMSSIENRLLLNLYFSISKIYAI